MKICICKNISFIFMTWKKKNIAEEITGIITDTSNKTGR